MGLGKIHKREFMILLTYGAISDEFNVAYNKEESCVIQTVTALEISRSRKLKKIDLKHRVQCQRWLRLALILKN